MNKEEIEIRASELLSLGESLRTERDLGKTSQLLHGAISLTEICYGSDGAQCSGLIGFRDGLISGLPRQLSDTRARAVPFTIGVLESLLSDLKLGLIGNLRQQIAGEILGDLIELAKTALSENKPEAINVAAVLAAASYDDTIRRMGSQLAGINDRRDLEKVLNELKKKDYFKGAQVSIAQSYLKFRNDALHADWDNIEKESVTACLGFIEELLLKHFS